jgi:site-specific DNA recombinase
VANRFTKQHACPNFSIRGEELEKTVWTDVRALLAEPRKIEQEYQRRLSLGDQSNPTGDRGKLSTLAVRVQRQISKLIDAYSDGLIDKSEFEPRVRSARGHLEKLQADLRSQEQIGAQIQEMRLVIGHLESFAQRVRGQLENADWATRRQLLSTLVKRIEVGKEEIRMVYRVDCGPFDLAPSKGPSGPPVWFTQTILRWPRAPMRSGMCPDTSASASDSAM